jgi:hypothetical protein
MKSSKYVDYFSRHCARNVLVVAAIFINAPSFALEVGDVKLSGFASAVAAVTDNETPYLREGFTHNANFVGDTLLGLQVDSKLGEQTSFSTQLIANDENDFSVDAEWLYITYRNSGGTAFRFGRLRAPKYILSPYLYVSAAYPWVRPPPLVYEVDPLTKHTGMDVIYQRRFGDAVLTLQPYVGQIVEMQRFFGFDVNLKSDYRYGIGGDLEYGHFLLHTYADTSKIRIGVGTENMVGAPTVMSNDRIIGLQYQIGVHKFMAEHAGYRTRGANVSAQRGSYVSYIHTFGNWNPYLTLSQRAGPASTGRLSSESSAAEIGTSYTHQHNIVSKYELHYGKSEDANGAGSFTDGATAPKDPTLLLFSAGLSILF